ncbi:MAG: hypothetical protein ACOX7R_03045 [Acetivibrionales bacterium]|jgi:hypothetical protein
MIKVLYGEKGKGKTKVLVESANGLVETCPGHIVFLDDSNDLIHRLNREIRFINVLDFPVKGVPGFFGFICGMISQNYDIQSVFIDGLTYILNQQADSFEGLFKDLKQISEQYGIDFHISINGKEDNIPKFLEEYVDF